ncbi:hypothetical protein [Microbacterium sp. A1-JK]|uniref:hypothetical protein n=1 Tax=Microbacterium sp. A1-JK TaxID=3177516 RepID=UPI00388B8770
MSTPKIGSYTPKELKDTVYLHLRPKTARWNNVLEGMTVVKAAKSTDAAVEPGDFIVKLEVTVPAEFFIEAMPSARIELSSGQIVPVLFEQQAEDETQAETV